jgi:hypothetical protein
MIRVQRRQGVAAFLSALVPGLGQLYNREWGKAAGFFVTLLILDGALGVSAGTLKFFESVAAGIPPADGGTLVLRMLPILGIAIWSVVDATRTAKKATA